MDERILTLEFASAVADEPPLGFDADLLMRRGARLRRRRRLGVAASAVVVVAGLIAVGAVASPARSGAPGIAVAASSTLPVATTLARPTEIGASDGLIDWPPPGATPVVSYPAARQALAGAFTVALRMDLTNAVPQAAITGQLPFSAGTDLTGEATGDETADATRDATGDAVADVPELSGWLGLTWAGRETGASVTVSARQRQSPAQRCALDRAEEKLPDKALTCVYSVLSDGGTLLVESYDPTMFPLSGAVVAEYRPDGVVVIARSALGPDKGESVPWRPLPTGALVTLATDPAFDF